MNMNINKAGKSNTVIKFKNNIGGAVRNAARNNEIGRSFLPVFFTASDNKAHR